VLKEHYSCEIEKLKTKIAEIDIKLAQLNIGDEEIIKECQLRKEEQDKRDELRREEYKREQEELLRKLFERFAYKESSTNKTRPCSENILQQLNINNKKDWKKWLLKNHPDKGGDNDLCGKVINTGKSRGW
jgi:hypothetical protein